MKITLENLNAIEIKYNDRGLVPAIVQDVATGTVLMQAYMNAESLQRTLEMGKVTFYSRSRQRLWTKGETSDHFLHVHSLFTDCDMDSILVLAKPTGPSCHTGTLSCFGDFENLPFLPYLQTLIERRKEAAPDSSYTASLFAKGVDKVAQKVGEEAVELVIEAKNDDRDKFIGEAGDLLYHYLVLLSKKDYHLKDVIELLQDRHRS